MFLHSKILNERKFETILKQVKNTRMSKYWFMENHFIPCLLNKNTFDLTSMMNNLEKSFSKLVENNYASEHKVKTGGDEAEKEVITAVKEFLAGPEGGIEKFLSGIQIPSITKGKSALLRKLAADVLNFVDNYKFTHPEKEDQSFFNEPIDKDTVNRMLGARMSMILGVEGNVFNDIVNFDTESIKNYYDNLKQIAQGTFTDEQTSIMEKYKFTEFNIQSLAKKLLEIISKKSMVLKGEEAAEKMFGPESRLTEEQKKLMDAKSIDDVVKIFKAVDEDDGQEYNIANLKMLIKNIKNRLLSKGFVVQELNKVVELYQNNNVKPEIVKEIKDFLQKIPDIRFSPQNTNTSNPKSKVDNQELQQRIIQSFNQYRDKNKDKDKDKDKDEEEENDEDNIKSRVTQGIQSNPIISNPAAENDDTDNTDDEDEHDRFAPESSRGLF
jgi:hypothetical protein